MNTIFTPATLVGTQNQPIILREVRARAWINDLFAKVEIEQRYENTEKADIEAIYTFPVAMDAVLLDFELEINGHTLAGTVMKKRESEEKYEDAIDRGDSAGLLEKAGPGLYSVSIGNLQPEETATIRYRYGQFLRWNGNRVRFTMPTTIAPRYGDPEAAGLEPHQIPEHTCDTQRSFHLEIAVRGILKDAELSSPSHTPRIEPTRKQTVIALDDVTAMDRDVVIEARTQKPDVARALVARDREGWVGLASFRPEIPENTKPFPRAVMIVVDCSGSMSGDSITLAREALERILDSLHEGDFFNIIAFGSSFKEMFNRPGRVSSKTIAEARGYVRTLDADMGGTQIGKALRAAYRTSGKSGLRTDLLLVTDGQVWNQDVVGDARESSCRIFPVGIGVSPSEAFLGELAAATGGVCEFVSPREDIAARIHRHFQRLYCAQADSASISWLEKSRQSLPDTLKTVYDGDTLHAFAWFDRKPREEARLTIHLPGGQSVEQGAPVQKFRSDDTKKAINGDREPSTLARMAAAHRIAENPEAPENPDLALAYRLISPWTNYIVEHIRETGKKADGQPLLRKVPQEIAAGWHGIGSATKVKRSHVRSVKKLLGRSTRRLAPVPHDVAVTGSALSAPSAPQASMLRIDNITMEAFDLRPAFAHRTDMDIKQPPGSGSQTSSPWPLNELSEEALSLIAWQIIMHQIQPGKRRIHHPFLQKTLAAALNGKLLRRGNLANVTAPDRGTEWITRVLHQPLPGPESKSIQKFWIRLPIANLHSRHWPPDDPKPNRLDESGKAMLDAWKALIQKGPELRFVVLVCDAKNRQYLLFELGTAIDIDPDAWQWKTGGVDPIHNLDLTEIGSTEFVVGKDSKEKQRLCWECSEDPLVWRNLQFDLQTPTTVRRLQLDADTMERAKSYLHGGKTGTPPVWETINLA